jgi:heavy metal efflux system protein
MPQRCHRLFAARRTSFSQPSLGKSVQCNIGESIRKNKILSRLRVTVQCNVRGRDVGSFVAEAQRKIGEQVKLPDGCSIEWGGQFENMKRANAKLAFVVPMALGLILVLLYFSLKSLRDVFIVATGIPLGAVGGVLALWLRGMPFTVSSAVGFVALSGVAIFNGLVLPTLYSTVRRKQRRESPDGTATANAETTTA